MRTTGYLPSSRADLRKAAKAKVVELLSDKDAVALERIPTPRASTHESLWLSEEEVMKATSLCKEHELSAGEAVTALLLRDFCAWEMRQPKQCEAPAQENDDAGPLGEALRESGKQPRQEQLRVLRTLRSFLSAQDGLGKVLFCEAGTGTGKTLAYLGAAVELMAANGAARVMVAAPTFALIEQIGTELALFGDAAPHAVFLAGQNEWVSEGAMNAFLDEKEGDLPQEQVMALKRWLASGGDGSRPRWSMGSLVETVPAFAFSADVSVRNRVTDDDRGHEAYVAQFEKAAEARLVVLTHSMLAWLVKRRIIAQMKALGGNTNIAEAVKSWKALPKTERERRFHEELNLAMADEGSDAGCDHLPNVDWLVVDEAHALEDAFAKVMSTEGSVGKLLAVAKNLHKRFPNAFGKNSLDSFNEVLIFLKELGKNRGDEDILSLGDRPELLHQIVGALDKALRTKNGTSKVQKSLIDASREAKTIKAMSRALKLVGEALEKGEKWAAAYLHWSPIREYPRISVGKLYLDREFHYLWAVVAARTTLVSGTLYEENPSYSCETTRRALAVPTASVVQMVPIHAKWQIDPVELCMIQAVHAPDGRPRFYRPASKLDAVERLNKGEKWLDDVSGYIADLIRLDATAGGVLVLGTAFADIDAVEKRLTVGMEAESKWKLMIQKPGVGLAGLRKEFMEESKNGKALLLAVGGAWTGFDLHVEDVPDALTDLVLMNAPFGLMGKTLARLRRQSYKNGHMEIAAHAQLLVRQGIGRLVRSPETPHNRRIHWLDARIHDPAKAGMFFAIRRFLARYRTLAVG